MFGVILQGLVNRENGIIWLSYTSSLFLAVSAQSESMDLPHVCFLNMSALCKANSRPAVCKLCVTCEAGATLYGKQYFSTLECLPSISGRGRRECVRGWLCLWECVCVSLSKCLHASDRGGSNREREREEESCKEKGRGERRTEKHGRRRPRKWRRFYLLIFKREWK